MTTKNSDSVCRKLRLEMGYTIGEMAECWNLAFMLMAKGAK